MNNKQYVLLTQLYNNNLYEHEHEQDNELPYHFMLIGIYASYTYEATHWIDDNLLCKIENTLYNQRYKNINNTIIQYKIYYKNLNKVENKVILNYDKIIKMPDYIKPEIGYVTTSSNGSLIVIKTTCWLKIFQKKIKKYLLSKNKLTK